MKIVSVKTKDDLELYGMFSSSNNDTIFIHTHGTGSSFYMEGFEQLIMQELEKIKIDSLFVNNRGAFLLEAWQDSGAAIEKFEDSVLDLDAWIEFALNIGYKNIILSGHSLGSEKVIYYIQFGKFKDKISKLFLLGFSDTKGAQERYEKKVNHSYMNEALSIQKSKNPKILLADGENVHSGELPISALEYINFYQDNSQLNFALPFAKKDLNHLSKIKIPVIGIIGDIDDEEWTIVPIDEAINMLENNLSNFICTKIKYCGHEFINKYQELSETIIKYIN